MSSADASRVPPGRETRAAVVSILGGLGIAALGLGVSIAVHLLGTPDAPVVTPREPRPGPDVTRAEPLPPADQILAELASEPRPPLGPAPSAIELATLERFPAEPDEPHPVVIETRRGDYLRINKQRHIATDAHATEVRFTAREKASRSRTRIQIAGEGAILIEHERLAEEQRRKEEAERLAREAKEAEEQALAEELSTSGTLVDGLASSRLPVDGGSPPVSGPYTISAPWGQVGIWSRYHTGIDIAAPIGRPVLAAADGVARAPVAGSWAGVHVIVEHPNGDATLYAHLAHSTVQPGEPVRAGQVIGAIGMTGRTFGPHLHFEYYPSVRNAANPYTTSDPFTWMLTQGVRL